ncbi:MAG: ATP-binding protein [Planctomycetaceae bacterium]
MSRFKLSRKSLIGAAVIVVGMVVAASAGPPEAGNLSQRPTVGGAIERVLVIDEEGPTRPAFVQLMEGFREGLSQIPGVRSEVFIETLDLVRLGRGANDPEQAADWLIEKYRGAAFDVVVPTSRVARQFVLANRNRLAPRGRIVAVERTGDEGSQGAGLADYSFVSIAPCVAKTIKVAHTLFPQARRVALIGQSLPHTLAFSAVVHEARAAAEAQGLEYVPLIDLNLSELCTRLRDLPPDAIVFYHAYWKDETGRTHVPAELLETLCREKSIPFLSSIDTYVGRGIVGGVCADVRALGRGLAKQVLEGRAGPNPPPLTVAPVPIFDERVLNRFGISESMLPPGSRVLFREPRLWERYWPQLVGGLALLVLEAGLILALLRQLRLRRRAERTVNEQRDQLAHAGRISTLGQFAASLAHELGQPLGAILNNLEAAEILLRDDNSAMAGELRGIVADIAADDRRAGAVLDRIRAMVRQQRFAIRPVDVSGLIRDVLALAGPRLQAERVAVTVHCDSGIPRVAGDEILLQQALLNLIANSADAIRGIGGSSPVGADSSAATARPPGTIAIQVGWAGEHVDLSLIDNGGGMQDDFKHLSWEPFVTTKAEGLGIGLPIVRSIMEQHDGQLEVDNVPGQGLAVRLRLPVWKHNREAGLS